MLAFRQVSEMPKRREFIERLLINRLLNVGFGGLGRKLYARFYTLRRRHLLIALNVVVVRCICGTFCCLADQIHQILSPQCFDLSQTSDMLFTEHVTVTELTAWSTTAHAVCMCTVHTLHELHCVLFVAFRSNENSTNI